MRIGINGSTHIALASPTRAIVDHARAAEADGFSTYWVAQLGWPDALTLLGSVGAATQSIELGTAVIATWPRHPLMLAGQALTVQEMCGNRLILGVGLAHRATVESTFNIPFVRPAKNMSEYLDVLLGVLTQRSVSVRGTDWSGEVEHLAVAEGVESPSVMLAAMGPRMLELAAQRTDGTILWLSGPRTIEEYIAPHMSKAAADVGRDDPRIVASVPVSVTDKPDEVRGAISQILIHYNDLPSYRQVMDREGADGPADVSIVGDEEAVKAGIARFADAGATDFSALEFGLDDEEMARTRALLRTLV